MNPFPSRATRRLAAALVLAAAPLAAGAQEAPAPFPMPGDPAVAAGGGLDRAAVEAIVREVISESPEIVYDALVEHQARLAEQARAAQSAAIENNYEALIEGAPAFGAEDPAVTLVEFFDYNCGYCKRSLDAVLRVLETQKDVRVVFIEYPILAPSSTTAARAALAAARQDRYLEFHAALMRHRGALTDELVVEIAAGAGLDTGRLARTMEEGGIIRAIDRNRALAQALGIQGTPAFLIGHELHPGALDEEGLRELIEEARAG